MAKVPAILEELTGQGAVERATHYFSQAGNRKSPFTGSSFESIGHRWDDPRFGDEFTASDLVALATLSIDLRGASAIHLLSPDFQSDASRLLAQIPQHASIGDPAACEKWLAKGKPAYSLWHLLIGMSGLGEVSVSKLLARKRAGLIPIYDEMINQGWNLGGSGNMWAPMHELLSRDHARLLSVGAQIGVRAGVPTYVAPLRVLDAVVWHASRFPDWRPGANDTDEATER